VRLSIPALSENWLADGPSTSGRRDPRILHQRAV